MSDTQQQHTDVGGNTQQPLSTAPPAQPLVNPQPVVQTPVPPPAGSLNKELIPPAPVTPDFATPSNHVEIAPQIAPEVAEAGVEHVPSAEHPQLSTEAIRAGLAVSPSQQPIAPVTGQTVTFPGEMNEEKAEQARKTSSWRDSFLWLVEEWWREKKKLQEKEPERK